MQSKRPSAAERASPQANLPLLKLSGPVHLPSRGSLARGGITSSEGGVSSRLRRTHPTTHTLTPPHQVTMAPAKPTVTATMETARPKKPELKSTEAPQRASGKSQRKAVASVKNGAAKPTNPSLVVPNQNPTYPLEDISDFLDHLPQHACVELARWLITSISSLPTGTARPRAVLKTVILFVTEYGCPP